MNALHKIIVEFRRAIEPLLVAANDPDEWKVLQAALGVSGVPVPAFSTSAIDSFLQNPDPELDDFLDLALEVAALESDLRALFTSLSTLDAEALLETATSALVVAYLQAYHPIVYCVCRMLALIETQTVPRKAEVVHFDRIGRLITDVHDYLSSVYPLQTEFDAKRTSDLIFPSLAAIAGELTRRLERRGGSPLQVLYGLDAPPTPGATIAEAIAQRTLSMRFAVTDPSGVQGTALLTTALQPADHGGPGLVLRFAGAGLVAPLGKRWTIDVDLASAFALVWKFGDGITVTGAADASLTVGIARAPDPARKPMVFPIAGGTRLEVGDIDFALSADAREIDAQLNIHNAALIAGKASSDSFSGSKLPSSGARGQFDLTVGISSVRGFYIGGTAGLSAVFVLNKTIGPLHLASLSLDLRPDPQTSDTVLVAGLAMSLKVGPVTAIVEGLGARVEITFPSTGANLGVVNLDASLQPPRGIGVVIAAGPLTGGGYVFFDQPAGRYAGVLQLEVKGIAIKAVGIVETKLPEGGYSFLIILSAEFAPIQLGLGFTLNGVGGLAGLHRTVAIPALQAAVRAGAADGVLFPKDPVKNAPRIIRDLQRFFPAQKDHYIFGPIALIGWGSPQTVLTVKLGVILEFPPPLRIALLGQLECSLPSRSNATVELHVDVFGVVDFGAKYFALDGTIHDSRIGPFSLSGDFAVRLRWGNAPSFAVAVGGFHPRFVPPPEFPALRRITIALSSGDNPRLTLQCYLALTSNSLQFGARAELYAAAAGFSVTGWIGFDVLIIFNPFGFRADLSAGFVLRRGSRNLGGVRVDATLTGPAPWHVWGEATINVLFFDLTVDFDLTIGDGAPPALPSTTIWPALQAAIQEAKHWSGVLPVAAAQVVTVKQPDDDGALPAGQNFPVADVALIDPVGNITYLSRIAPLARRMSLFADARPASGTKTRFDLDHVTVGTQKPAWTYVHELFPPAQFEALSDEEKLSRPSFERMAAGMSLDERVTAGGIAGKIVTTRTVVVDSPSQSHDAAVYTMPAGLLIALAEASSAGTGGLRNATEKYVPPGTVPGVSLDEERYVVATVDELTARLDIAPAGTKGAVLSALRDYLESHAAERGSFTVVAEYEAAA